jgi:hypothetical protein
MCHFSFYCSYSVFLIVQLGILATYLSILIKEMGTKKRDCENSI